MNLRRKIILKMPSMHRLGVCIVVFFMFLLTNAVQAQVTPPVADTSLIQPDSTLSIAVADSLQADSTAADSASKASLEQRLGIKLSPAAMDASVISEAEDSAVFNLSDNLFHLYGKARVNYEDLQLDAGKVSFNQGTGVVTASPLYDSSGGVVAGRPSFKQGEETFTYDSLQYNFSSKRAIVRNARTQYGEGYVFSEQIKRNPDQSIFGWHNVYTTCSLDTPHFGISARRIKIIPNRVIATGSANITIEGVPTPGFLPFGLFPITQGQRSGFRLPTYTIEDNRGLGLVNGGYYFYINDYVDFLALASIFSKGSWSVSGVSTYANRYRYSGGLSFSYGYNKSGESYEPGSSINKDFRVQWSHRTDPKARPGISFSASVDAGSSQYYQNNSYDINQIQQNQYSSSITFQKVWQTKPYSLTIGSRYNQDVQRRLISLDLPNIAFNIAQINPFQTANSTGEKFYEKITASYSVSAINQISFYDSSFSLGQLSTNDFRNGIKHTIPISASYNVLRFINMSFSIPYTEYWLTEQSYKYFNTDENKLDTMSRRGFYTARDVNASVNFSTRIYGLKLFKKGRIAGIRHVLEPRVGYTYTPDFAANPYRYYYQTRLAPTSDPQYVSAYDGSVVGVPGFGQAGDISSSVNFGLNNNLQMKVRGKDTTGARNVALIDGFSITSAYNIAADSFQLAPIILDFRTNLLNKINITANASFDPYAFDYQTGRRINRTLWESGHDQGGIARFQRAALSVGGTFQSKQQVDPNREEATGKEEFRRMTQYNGYSDYIDFNVPWRVNISYTLNASRNYQFVTQRDSTIIDHATLFDFDLNLTPKWKLVVRSGYNFSSKQLSLTQIDIYRDLHCWEMRLGAIPFGDRKSYNFSLNVKASVLQDLKLQRRRDYRDAVQ